jgi:hypothetical protein
MRLAQMQVCPLARNLEAINPSAAASRSASSKTRKGAFPPSSIVTRFTVEAESAISFFPTAVEPVKLSFLMSGLRVNSGPMTEASPVRTEKSPAGSPARSASSASARAENGVCGAGFTSMAQPAASAGATFRVIIAMGKFHGVIAAQRPTGSFITSTRLSADGPGMISPSMRTASAANHSM